MRAAQRAVLDAELTFPARIKIAVPSSGLGQRLDAMQRWLDDNAGADRWAMAPAGRRGVRNDAVAIYFMDAVLAGAFVTRMVCGQPGGDYRGRVSGPRRCASGANTRSAPIRRRSEDSPNRYSPI
jgi:hypothetical protein